MFNFFNNNNDDEMQDYFDAFEQQEEMNKMYKAQQAQAKVRNPYEFDYMADAFANSRNLPTTAEGVLSLVQSAQGRYESDMAKYGAQFAPQMQDPYADVRQPNMRTFEQSEATNKRADTQQRAEAAGIYDEPEDTRNFVQKALNLNSTGFLGGIMETLNRPQQALTNYFDVLTQNTNRNLTQEEVNNMSEEELVKYAEERAAAQKEDEAIMKLQNAKSQEEAKAIMKENPEAAASVAYGLFNNALPDLGLNGTRSGKSRRASAAFVKGLTGERTSNFGQVTRNIAQDGKLEDGNFDWTDVVGFAGDVILDPINIGTKEMFKSAGGLAKSKEAQTILNSADELAQGVDSIGAATKAATGATNIVDDAVEAGMKTAKTMEQANFKEIVHKMNSTYDEIADLANKAGNIDFDFKKLYESTKDAQNLGDFTKGAHEALDKINDSQKFLSEMYSLPKEGLTAAQRKMAYTDLRSKLMGSAVQGGKDVMGKTLDFGSDMLDARALSKVQKNSEILGDTAEQLASKQDNVIKASRAKASQFSNDLRMSLSDVKKKLATNRGQSKAIQEAALASGDDFLNKTEDIFTNSPELQAKFATADDFRNQISDLFEFVERGTDKTDARGLFSSILDDNRKIFNQTPEFNQAVTELNDLVGDNISQMLGAPKGTKLFEFYENTDGKFIRANPDIFGAVDQNMGKVGDQIKEMLNQTIEQAGEQGNLLTGALDDMGNPIVKELNKGVLTDAIDFGRAYTPDEIAKYQDLLNTPGMEDGFNSYKQWFTQNRENAGHLLTGNSKTFEGVTERGYTPHTRGQEQRDFFSELLRNEDVGMTDFARSYEDAGKTNVTSGAKRVTGMKHRKFTGSRVEANRVIKEEMKERILGEHSLDDMFGGNLDLQKKAKEVLIDKPFFTENLEPQMDKFMKVLDDQSNQKKMTDVLMAGMFGDQTISRTATDNATLKVVKNGDKLPSSTWKKLTQDEVSYLKTVFETRSKHIGSSPQLDAMLDNIGNVMQAGQGKAGQLSKDGLDMVVQKDLYNMMFQHQPSTAEGFLKGYDKLMNVFKRGKITSAKFNVNNLTGNSMNQYVSGMSFKEMAKANTQSYKFLKEVDEVTKLVGKGGYEALDTAQRGVFDRYLKLVNEGILSPDKFAELQDMLPDMASKPASYFSKQQIAKEMAKDPVKSKLGKAVVKPFKAISDGIIDANENVDSIMRLGTYLHAESTPEFAQRLGLKSAREAAALVNYDPTNLTIFEQNVMKRAVPFYTFARQNMALQLKNLEHNYGTINKINRGAQSLWEGVGIDPNQLKGYEKENYYVPGLKMFTNQRDAEEKKEGKYSAFKSNLPISDINEFLDSGDTPVKTVKDKFMGMASPVIKAPFELAGNHNYFTNSPIENYGGEPDKRYPGSKKMWHAIGQTGADVPLKSIYDAMQIPAHAVKGDVEEIGVDLQKLLGISTDGSTSQNKDYEERAKTKELEDLIKRAKAQGIKVPTKAQLKKMGFWD